MEVRKYSADLLVLRLASATEEEIREFTGGYLSYIREGDHVIALSRISGKTQPDMYAAPWRGDILVKPVSAPDSVPLVIRGDNEWAAVLFGG
jgi:hypothetical protein